MFDYNNTRVKNVETLIRVTSLIKFHIFSVYMNDLCYRLIENES